MDASKEILEVVERVKKDAEQAEKAFDTQNDELTRKSSRSIDLFGGSASSQVVEIASMAREACDSLYASLQTLVKITDEECRPLLAQGADTQAVKEALEQRIRCRREFHRLSQRSESGGYCQRKIRSHHGK